MNAREAGGVLLFFSSIYPNHVLAEGASGWWAELLVNVNPEDADKAMRQIAVSDEFHPSLKRFKETCESMARRRHMENADTRGIEASTEEELPMSESAGRARALRAGLHAVKDDAA